MDIDTEKIGTTFVFSLKEKRLDSSVNLEFESTMKKCIANNETCILLDMTNVNFVDSAGLGSMVSCLKNLKSNDSEGIFALAGVSEQIMSLFNLTRMDRVFTIYTNRAEALQKI